MNNFNLNIDEYFSLIQQKIKDKDFKILELTSKPESTISVYLESVNYLMYEFAQDHGDERQIFPYIIIPNDTDWDFTTITLKQFINFLARNKSKEIINTNTDNIEYINCTESSDDNVSDVDEFWLD